MLDGSKNGNIREGGRGLFWRKSRLCAVNFRRKGRMATSLPSKGRRQAEGMRGGGRKWRQKGRREGG